MEVLSNQRFAACDPELADAQRGHDPNETVVHLRVPLFVGLDLPTLERAPGAIQLASSGSGFMDCRMRTIRKSAKRAITEISPTRNSISSRKMGLQIE